MRAHFFQHSWNVTCTIGDQTSTTTVWFESGADVVVQTESSGETVNYWTWNSTAPSLSLFQLPSYCSPQRPALSGGADPEILRSLLDRVVSRLAALQLSVDE